MKEVVALLPVVLLISSACGIVPVPLGRNSSESPGESQGFRYRDPLFILELKNVEVFDNEIKMTFMYTNLMRVEQYARPTGPVARAYLVDNLGNRYPYARDSLERPNWPSQIPVEFWITFAKATPGASSVNLILAWVAYARESGPRDLPSEPTIMFRRIPLPVAPAAGPGFRYSHQLFTLELKSVDVVNDEVRINLTYTNRTSSPQVAGIGAGDAYLVDNLGKRYKYISDSFGRTKRGFPPQAPEEIWITFGTREPGSSSVNLILPWRAADAAPVSVILRDIPLPQ